MPRNVSYTPKGYGSFLDDLEREKAEQVSTNTPPPATPPRAPAVDESDDGEEDDSTLVRNYMAKKQGLPSLPVKQEEQPAPTQKGDDGATGDDESYGFSEDMGDSALKDAQALGNEKLYNARKGEALGRIATAFNTKEKYDPSFYHSLAGDSDRQSKQLEERRKGASAEEALTGTQVANDEKTDAADPDSDVSVATRKSYASILKASGLPPDVMDGMSAADVHSFLERPVETMARLKQSKDLKEASMANANAIRQGNMNFKDTQLEKRQDFQREQRANSAVKNDKTLNTLSGNYNNIKNALLNLDQTGIVPPQAFEDLQAIVITNMGIKGAGGVGERQARKMHSMGISAADTKQLLYGRPEDLGKNNKMVNYYKELAQFEMENIHAQAQQRLKAVKSTNLSDTTSEVENQFGGGEAPPPRKPDAGGAEKRLPDGTKWQKVGNHWVEVK